ncbi:hypothetical protein ACLHDG_08325 [Sulfurovum sp. CS9]|uniref:hypothetical protein n=1 Tax=Sulfurovum sp. CS9 TaxID=3391146 RepID=UPI0039E8FB6F
MKEKTFLKWGMVLIFFTLMFQNAYGDIYMKQKQHTDAVTMMGQTQPAKDVISESWITSDKVVTMSEKQKVIIDMNKKIITMIDHEAKSIVDMPMDFSKSMDKKGDMSEEEKAGFQQLMGAMMQMDVKVEETNERKKIGKWNCQKYLQTINMAMGTTNSEIWATEDIKVDGDLYAKYSVGILAQIPGMGQNMSAVTQELKKIKGVHVYSEQTITMMGQPMKSSIELIEFKEGKAPSNIFDLPAEYKKAGAFR